jgi:hypothetical protein
MRVRRIVGGVAIAGACALSARDARAFCRTTTCPLPPSFSPQPTSCFPTDLVDGSGNPVDFATYCASIPAKDGGPYKVLPLFWRNACVGYDIQKDASKWAPLSEATQIVADAFAQWTQVTCPVDAAGDTRPSIQVSNQGPVECGQVGYNRDGAPNQHVIVFHDTHWPHDAATPGGPTSASTLGLTTVTFDADTGEIYDADTEINGTVPLSAADPVPSDGFDLRSIITHEMGHFLGLAHSGDGLATMYALYTPGSTSMRSLTADDVAGICAVYPANKTRTVDPSVAAGGSIPADSCNATPRHGWSSQCDQQPKRGGCAVGSIGRTPGFRGPGALVAALALLGVARTRRRPPAARRSK